MENKPTPQEYEKYIKSINSDELVFSCNPEFNSRITEKIKKVREEIDTFISDEAVYKLLAERLNTMYSELNKYYNQYVEGKFEGAFEDCINQNGQYVVLSSIKDFYNFISDPQGNLNRYLFDSNVRDYLGLNPVNSDILDSLKKQRGDAPNF